MFISLWQVYLYGACLSPCDKFISIGYVYLNEVCLSPCDRFISPWYVYLPYDSNIHLGLSFDNNVIDYWIFKMNMEDVHTYNKIEPKLSIPQGGKHVPGR
jgi:hypothetical protein